MKYLRSYLLVPGAGGQILGSRSSGHRPLRRLSTAHRHSKVTSSYSSKHSLCPKRRVSTDGAKKSQLAVVGQVAPALPPPNIAGVGNYVSVQRHGVTKPCPSHKDQGNSLTGQSCPRHGQPYLSVCPKTSPKPMSYGQFLSESIPLTSSLDPMSLEMAFLPTFHFFKNDVGSIFFPNRPQSAGAPSSSIADATRICHDMAETSDSEIVDLGRSKSLEALLLPAKPPLPVDDVILEVPTRNVKREIVLPRTSEPAAKMSQGSFDHFLKVHNFQKRDSNGSGEEKSEDISSFPKYEDAFNAPSGSLIIQNDRSSVIIHRDLYITNRILEKLKKMEEKPETTPEPAVKVGDYSVARYESVADVGAEGSDHPQEATDPEACPQAISCRSSVGSSSLKSEDNSGSALEFPSIKLSSTLQNVHPKTCDNYLTNMEFGTSSDQMTALEYMALQSRKKLYARMKNVSSPCVLVDGVHVKHAKLEEVMPRPLKENDVDTFGSYAKAGTNSDSCCFSMVSGDTNSVPDDMRSSPAPVYSSNSNLSEPKHLINSTPPESSLLLPESYNVPLHVPRPIHLHDSKFQGILEFTQSEPTELITSQHSLGDLDSDKLQSELEDWFIPLGNEIDSMLLTLEASKSPLLYSEQLPQEVEESDSIFEEISDVREHDGAQMERDGSYPFEEVEIIENALLSPREHEPFGSGQYRDKNTSSGTLPPKSKNPNVDIRTETTIKCCRSGENTDINVTETQRYLDKRLPYPFCTETVLQVYGTSDSLSKATQAVENSKAQLVHLSNANSPNPGMLTPKLQFNHMLSKSHENVKPSSKKTVLKIKVVPNTETSFPTAPSSEPKPQPSHVLQLAEHSDETSTDVSKLIRRSKFNHKTRPKKGRRGDSVMKLRPRKKFNKESSENIKILSPKDLEKMFPSPPKPKPVEKPRKVTIETKMGKESPDTVENVKQRSTQSGFMAAHFKSRKVHDDILIKPITPKSADVKVIDRAAAEPVAQSIKPNQVPKEESDGALSVRDQKILKSIISHKVKDSFMAINKKGSHPAAANEVAKPELVKKGVDQVSPKTPIRTGRTGSIVSDRTESSNEIRTNPSSIDETNLRSSVSQMVNSMSSEIEYNLNKTNQGYKNDNKNVHSSILGTAKEKKEEKTSSRKPDSPTPKPHREYVAVETETSPRKTIATTIKAAPEKAPLISDKKVEKKPDDSVLPVSASAMIAQVMKSSGEVSQSESRWHHLDKKTAPNENPSEHFSPENTPSNVQKRPVSAKSAVQRKTQRSKTKPEAKSDGKATSPDIQKANNKRVESVKMLEAFKEKKVWNHPAEPLFFPFETPNYKEIMQELPRESQSTQPIPPEASSPTSSPDPSIYEADFCKLSAESTPRLVQSAPARYRVPLDRMKDFPLVNPGKAKTYSVPSSGAVSITPLHDIVLMRSLTQVPAVTKILGATLSAKSQQALDRWKQGLISTLGEQGFQEFYQNQLKRGTEFHSSVKKFLLDRLDSKEDLCMHSLSSVLGSVSDVSVVESQVIHPLLGYRGVVDCVAKYKGKPVVIEWKRSDKAKPSLKHTYDAPLQLTAYFGAMNFDSNYKAQQVEGGVVVVAYSDGSPADVFELSVEECERYWAKWLKRLHQYYTKSASA